MRWLHQKGLVSHRVIRRLAVSLAGLVIGGVIATVGGIAGASASTHSATKSPLVWGADWTLSGPLAAPGYGANSYFDAYIDGLNHAGGIDGHKIRLIELDDRGDPGQALLNVETLWSQDHVIGIFYGGQATIPLAYIKANRVPTIQGSGALQDFLPSYPTIFPTTNTIATDGAQTSYWAVHIQHLHPQIVEVLYNPAYSVFNGFIQHYWTVLGAKHVYFYADQGSTADCSSLVLLMKSEGVQYFDIQGATEWENCILAEVRLGWKPPLAQGGAVTSSPKPAELIGQPMVGVIGGSPSTLANGEPIYSHPTPIDREYAGDIRTYAPQLYTYSYLNADTIQDWGHAELVAYVLRGTLENYGRVTSSLFVKYFGTVRNFQDGIDPPVASFDPRCKTGGNGTVWGFWHYDASRVPSYYEVLTSGRQWITDNFLGNGPCFLSKQIETLFPNG